MSLTSNGECAAVMVKVFRKAGCSESETVLNTIFAL